MAPADTPDSNAGHARAGGPDGPERHRSAVEQTARWARDAAAAGDYQDALSWLRVLEQIERSLPEDLALLRDRCTAMVAQSAAAYDRRRAAFANAQPELTPAPSPEPSPRRPDRSRDPTVPPRSGAGEVEHLVQSYITAFNDRDLDGICSCFAPAATIYPTPLSATRRHYTGREGVGEWVREVCANPIAYKAAVTEIRPMSDGRWAFLGIVTVGGIPESGFGATILVRDGLIAELHSYLSDEQLLLDLGVLT